MIGPRGSETSRIIRHMSVLATPFAILAPLTGRLASRV
jgi:hypothetical protein